MGIFNREKDMERMVKRLNTVLDKAKALMAEKEASGVYGATGVDPIVNYYQKEIEWVEHYIEYTNLHIKLEVEGETQNMSWFRKAVMRITQSSPYKERHYVEISLAQDEADHLLKTIENNSSMRIRERSEGYLAKIAWSRDINDLKDINLDSQELASATQVERSEQTKFIQPLKHMDVQVDSEITQSWWEESIMDHVISGIPGEIEGQIGPVNANAKLQRAARKFNATTEPNGPLANHLLSYPSAQGLYQDFEKLFRWLTHLVMQGHKEEYLMILVDNLILLIYVFQQILHEASNHRVLYDSQRHALLEEHVTHQVDEVLKVNMKQLQDDCKRLHVRGTEEAYMNAHIQDENTDFYIPPVSLGPFYSAQAAAMTVNVSDESFTSILQENVDFQAIVKSGSEDTNQTQQEDPEKALTDYLEHALKLSKYRINVMEPVENSEGSFAQIYKAEIKEKHMSELVAVKFLKGRQIVHSKLLKRVRHEAHFWNMAQQHQNVLRLLGYCNTIKLLSPVPGLVSPLCKGHLEKHVKGWKNRDIKQVELLHDVASGLLHSMCYMFNGCQSTSLFLLVHSKGLLHCDLRAANILIGDRGQAILADFGLTTTAEQLEEHAHLRTEQKATNELWLAPELLKFDNGNAPRCTEYTDMYSFGCVFYEVWAQRIPFADVNRLNVSKHKLDGGLPTRPTSLADDSEHWKFISQCMAMDRSIRPSAANAIQYLKSAMQIS